MRGGALLFLLVPGLVAAGCSSALRPEQLQVWVGRPASALQQEWGPATREVKDGDRHVLIYEQLERASGRDFSTPTVGRESGYSPAQAAAIEALLGSRVYVRSYIFWVDQSGTIVRSTVHEP